MVVVGAGAVDVYLQARALKQQTTIVNERIAAGEEEVVKNEMDSGTWRKRVTTCCRAPGHHKIAAEGQEEPPP